MKTGVRDAGDMFFTKMPMSTTLFLSGRGECPTTSQISFSCVLDAMKEYMENQCVSRTADIEI